MQEMKRQRFKREKVGEEEEGVEEDETVSFIELPPNNLSKLPEKGILKNMPKAESGSDKEKWGDELSQSDNQEVLSQSDAAGDRGSDVLTEVERTLKSMNGYHEDILEALRNAASHRGASQSNLTEELRKSLSDSIPDYGMAVLKGSAEKLNDSAEHVEDTVPPCGPIRIRNLEDLIRQLERHPSRHMSPAGSEDIRFSETEADRHYRLDRQELASCAESQRCALEPDATRFVFGRFRQPTAGAERPHKGSRVGEDAGGSRDDGRGSGGSGSGIGGYGRQRAAGFDEPEVEPEAEEVENGEFVCKHLMRSASEEALPSSVKREHSFERNLNSGHHEKTLKGQTFDYFPSPPSEDSYPDSYEENASFPAPSVSSGSRSGSNDQVFLERQGRSERRDRASGDSKGKARQLPKSQSPFYRRGNDHYYS